MTAPNERLAVAVAFDTAVSNGVGMSLGAWAGRGDWAACGTEFRDRAGQRALSELDDLIGNLTAYRERLAAALLTVTRQRLAAALEDPGTPR